MYEFIYLWHSYKCITGRPTITLSWQSSRAGAVLCVMHVRTSRVEPGYFVSPRYVKRSEITPPAPGSASSVRYFFLFWQDLGSSLLHSFLSSSHHEINSAIMASDQIRQMVNFILQEAHEKANEIRVKVRSKKATIQQDALQSAALRQWRRTVARQISSLYFLRFVC